MRYRYARLTRTQPGVLAEFPKYIFGKEHGKRQVEWRTSAGYHMRYMETRINKHTGHVEVTLRDKDGHHVCESLKKLVAHAYMDNPENHPYIMCIDGDKQNTSLSNLEFSSVCNGREHNKLKSGAIYAVNSKFVAKIKKNRIYERGHLKGQIHGSKVVSKTFATGEEAQTWLDEQAAIARSEVRVDM